MSELSTDAFADHTPDQAADATDLEYDRTTGPADEPQFLAILGTAGTGKSTLARERATAYSDAVLLATTGIAAINLGGTTINSQFRYYDTAHMQTEYELGRLGATLGRMGRSGFRRIILDEISMMDGRQLDILCLAIDETNDRLNNDGIAPIGLTLVGDWCQLPPVKAPFAFQQPSWDRFKDSVLLLTEPRRQADHAFIRALQAVRRGAREEAVEYFRPFCTKSEDRSFVGASIMAKNDEVDRFNKLRMLQLPGVEDVFVAERGGEQNSEWKHIPVKLGVKPGARVMILANAYDTETRDLIYCNGDLGEYLGKVGEKAARVRLIRNNTEVTVSPVLREKVTATGARGKKKDRASMEGWIEYTPLRAAWATSCHKSQGLTLARVQLLINSQFWMTSGMTYVGLSRCQTPEGLRIVGTVDQFAARVRANPLLKEWY